MMQSPSLKIFSFSVTAVCFMVMATALLISDNMNQLLSHWSDEIHVNIYLSESLSADEQISVEQRLLTVPGVSSFEVVSQSKAIELLENQLSGVAASLGSDKELLKMIPTTYSIGLDPRLSVTERITESKKIAQIIQAWPEVEDVSYGQEWLKNYSGFAQAVRYGLNFLLGLVGAASVLIISNAIRAKVEERRTEIEILELVGATQSMIQRPFVQSGALFGFSAGLCGIALSFALYYFLKNQVLKGSVISDLYQYFQFLNPIVIIALVAFATALGAIGSYFCVRKINTGWAAANR